MCPQTASDERAREMSAHTAVHSTARRGRGGCLRRYSISNCWQRCLLRQLSAGQIGFCRIDRFDQNASDTAAFFYQ